MSFLSRWQTSIVSTPARSPAADRAKQLEALYQRPGFLLRRAHQIAVSLFTEESAAFNITTTQYGVLVILRVYDDLDQIGVSKKVGLDRSTTGLVIQKLERERLVVRLADPADGRRKIIVLTAKGERLLKDLQEPAARAQEIALSPFEPDEAEQFLRLLDKFVTHFNEKTRAPLL